MNIININTNDFEINDENCKIIINNDEVNLRINGNSTIYDFNECENLKLKIDVLENSSINYYMFSNNNFKNKIIEINNYENSITNFNYSFINNDNCKLIINNNIIKNNIKSNIRVRGVALENATAIIDSNGKVTEKTLNNEFNEDLRGLNLENGFIKINPNMFIDSNDVIANHNSTIGNINKDYLFYLNSKGIENDNAKKLIISGFLKSILNSDMNEIIDKNN